MQKALDIELALFLIKHIEEPCIEPQTKSNIRDFYIRQAKKLIKEFENPFATDLLNQKIQEYSSEQYKLI
jgi:hypothetical protein